MSGDLDRRRARAIERRKALDATERTEMSLAVAERVLTLETYQQAQSVGLYVAAGGEVDPTAIAVDARSRGGSTWYPLAGDGSMRFRRWDGEAPLQPGRFGMKVPPPDEECDGSALDAVITPLVLFGPHGMRVGRGGGHYDRTFASRATSGRPTLLGGLAYDFQQDDELTAEWWDVPLDVVVTPTRTILR